MDDLRDFLLAEIVRAQCIFVGKTVSRAISLLESLDVEKTQGRLRKFAVDRSGQVGS